MFFVQLGHGATAVRQRGNIAALALLTKQFIDEGFVNAKEPGDLTFCLITAFHGVNESFTKV